MKEESAKLPAEVAILTGKSDLSNGMIDVQSVNVRYSAAPLVTRAGHNTSTRLNIIQFGLPKPDRNYKRYTHIKSYHRSLPSVRTSDSLLALTASDEMLQHSRRFEGIRYITMLMIDRSLYL